MEVNKSANKWANDLTQILNAIYDGPDRLRVNIPQFAIDYSNQYFPDDPILGVEGADLSGFEGGLFQKKKGWVILYNDTRTSGRVRFTVAHEFGHYLCHRLKYPGGIKCHEEDLASWDSEYGRIEAEANTFAASFLMPLDDFRKQLSAEIQVNIDELGLCADRYDVSLIASTLRWLGYTKSRSILVVARDGFILWARSSQAAMETGIYYKTSNCPPIEIPCNSLAAKRELIGLTQYKDDLDCGVWFDEPCHEEVLFSDQYDFSISLIHFEEQNTVVAEEHVESDTLDRFNQLWER